VSVKENRAGGWEDERRQKGKENQSAGGLSTVRAAQVLAIPKKGRGGIFFSPRNSLAEQRGEESGAQRRKSRKRKEREKRKITGS